MTVGALAGVELFFWLPHGLSLPALLTYLLASELVNERAE